MKKKIILLISALLFFGSVIGMIHSIELTIIMLVLSLTLLFTWVAIDCKIIYVDGLEIKRIK